MASKAEVLKSLKGSELYKSLHHPTNEISRDDIEDTVNVTGQATDRLMDLQRRVKVATTRNTDYPKELNRDADELRAMIQTAIVTLYADSEDGSISNADFKQLFDPLAGMTEGLLGLLQNPDVEAQIDLRSMKRECVGKAFYRQLKHLLESGTGQGRVELFSLGKALSSLQTHIYISAEKSGELREGIIRAVKGLLDRLMEKVLKGDLDHLDELREVASWGLVEANLKKELIPPSLTKAKGHPKDDEEGEEPEQKTDVEKGLPKKIDKQALAPDEKTGKKKLVELKPSGTRGLWGVHTDDTWVGEVTCERHIRRVSKKLQRVQEYTVKMDSVILKELLGLEEAPDVEVMKVRSLPEAKVRITEMLKGLKVA